MMAFINQTQQNMFVIFVNLRFIYRLTHIYRVFKYIFVIVDNLY